MIRTFIDLPLAEGGAERLLHLFRRLRILEVCASQPGCRSAELTIAKAVWDDHDAYGRWLDHPDRARFGGATADLLHTPVSGEMTGARFRVAHVAPSSGGKTGRGEESR